MAEMLIQSERLTSIADEIRILSGTEDAMSLDLMESHIVHANLNIAQEADLIERIASALDGKAGGNGNRNIDTCSINLSVGELLTLNSLIYTTIADDGKLQLSYLENVGKESGMVIDNILCGSLIYMAIHGGTGTRATFSDNFEIYDEHWYDEDYNEYVVYAIKAPGDIDAVGYISVTNIPDSGGN